MNRIVKDIRNVLTAIVISVLEPALYSWFVLGGFDIFFVMVFSMLILIFSFIFMFFLLSLQDVLKKEIPYPWDILMTMAGGTISVIIFMFLLRHGCC